MISKNIIMLLDNAYKGDPRVQKEVQSLIRAGYEIDLFCIKDSQLADKESEEHFRIHRIISEEIFDVKKPSYFDSIAQDIISTINNVNIIHCHDHTMLHLGVKLKALLPNTKLIYDSHELFYSFPLVNIPKNKKPLLYLKSAVVRSILKKREHKDIAKADLVITVNHSIGKLLQHHHELSAMPSIVKNTPNYTAVKPNKDYFRKLYNLPSSTYLLIFISGKIHPKGHNLEQVINELQNKPDLALIITGKGDGRSILEEKVSDNKISNVFFHDPVKPEQIIHHLSGADFGLLPFWNKSDLSYWYALPNKIFEYLMAGLPILSTAQPEYKKIIEAYNVGVTVNPDVPNAFAQGIEDVIANKQYFKQNVLKASKILNWKEDEKTLLEAYQKVINKS